MSGWFEQAQDRIDREWKSGKFDKYAAAMKDDVRDALTGFCMQDEEFAQAVVQGGSFEDCMKAVAKCVKGNAISDMEAFGAAVRFYFPGAKIRVEMTIDLVGEAAGDDAEALSGAARQLPQRGSQEAGGGKDGLLIDLSDFF